ARRVGVVVYTLAAGAALFVHTPMGGNVVRLGSLVGGPLVACAIVVGSRRPRLAVPGGSAGAALAVALLGTLAVWQWSPAVRDVKKAYEDPSTNASYYSPLIGVLKRMDPNRTRIEIPFTRS